MTEFNEGLLGLRVRSIVECFGRQCNFRPLCHNQTYFANRAFLENWSFFQLIHYTQLIKYRLKCLKRPKRPILRGADSA